MPDEFARLRKELYLEGVHANHEGFRCLAAACLGARLEHGRELPPQLELNAALCAAPPAKPVVEAAFERLGYSAYLDQRLAEVVRTAEPELRRELERRIATPETTHQRSAKGVEVVYAFARAAELRPFESAEVRRLLRAGVDNRLEHAAVVELVGYVAEAALQDATPELHEVVRSALPWGVRAEALLALTELHGLGAAWDEFAAAGRPEDLREVLNVIGLLESGDLHSDAAVVQSVFYGDPTRLGKGGSGGIGSLLRELGSGLAARGRAVVTLVCYDSRACGYRFEAYREIAPGHLLVRIPVYLPSQDADGFLRAEHRVERAVEHVFRGSPIGGGAIHVRFLDNASRAVARVAQAHRRPIVVTLTPDPHRTVCGADGALLTRSEDEALSIFNRVVVGDELLRRADGVVAIGRNAFAEQLIAYYPQLENIGSRVTAAIDEGVATGEPPALADPTSLLCDCGHRHALDSERLAWPCLVSVGRLSEIKGQVALVHAWSKGGLHERFNLVLVGGDLESPSPEEQRLIAGIRGAAAAVPAGRFAHLPAQDNGVVRALLSWHARRVPERDGLDHYVCPSLKEEFGLSILEAMACEMPVLAPLRGGPRSYIRHGVNGFLVDTRDAATLQKELRVILIDSPRSLDAVTSIKHEARRTVLERYSVEAMAAEYDEFYRRVAAAAATAAGSRKPV